MAPIFSVIVPIYNVQDYLKECIDSLAAQTFQNLEIIMIDDVSTDNSLQIARELAAKYSTIARLIPHQKNKGLGGARNTGIDAATGQYLIFLDSDDTLQPDALAQIYDVICREEADVVEFCLRLVDEQGRYLRRTYCQEGSHIPALTRSVNACNKAIRAELFGDVRFPEKQYYEDYATIPKLLISAKKVASLNRDLYNYRQRTGSIVHDTNQEKNRDIMVGTDALLAYSREKGLGDKAQTQLEYLAICHVLYHAVLRVNGIDRRSPLQKELKDYVQSKFPNYRQNPHRALFSQKQLRLLSLIEKERWGTLYLCYHIRNRITGAVKRLIRK